MCKNIVEKARKDFGQSDQRIKMCPLQKSNAVLGM
jgi:hypothetical protein